MFHDKFSNKFLNKARHHSKSVINWRACLPLTAIIALFWSYAAFSQGTATPPPLTPEKLQEELHVGLNTLWVAIASFLIFFMNAGFALVESGFCRRKNAVNILAKNLIVFAIATVSFWAIGFSLMFGNGNDFIGFKGFFFSNYLDNSPAVGSAYQGDFTALNWATVPLEAKFLFQLMFAGTAATIVSGAVAERIKFAAFLLFSFFLVGVSYAITGHWIWGGGWLGKMGFFDFAGSTVVHSAGGWAALVGAALLGHRYGRYDDRGRVRAMPGHNIALSTLGCLILWLGWFGFNPGSTMDVNPRLIAHIALTTNMGAATGGLAATITAWLYLGKPDLSMIINGILAGLVSVTASCAFINIPSAGIIGFIAGILVVFAVGIFDSLRVDDPVGAVSVHLVCGVWGTIALGLFSQSNKFGANPAPKLGLLAGGSLEQLGIQLVGVFAVGAFTVIATFIAWKVIGVITEGIRVSREEEIEGLDIGEHGMEAYSDFMRESDLQ